MNSQTENGAYIAGPVAVRPMEIGPCSSHRGHTHNYDHLTVVYRGRVRVEFCKGPAHLTEPYEVREYGAGETFTVKADIYHTIKPLTADALWLCIYDHRDESGVVVEQYTGHQGAYE